MNVRRSIIRLNIRTLKLISFHIIILFLTLASRIAMRFIILAIMPNLWRTLRQETGIIYGILRFGLFVTRIYQLSLPIYIMVSISLGVSATLIRYHQYELTHTKLFFLSILDMLAVLLGDLLYLVLEYSKTWFSIFGFNELGAFIGIIMPFPIIPSIFLLLSELIILLLLKHPSLSKYLDKVTYSFFFQSIYFSLTDYKHDKKSALSLIFILSLFCFIFSTLIYSRIIFNKHQYMTLKHLEIIVYLFYSSTLTLTISGIVMVQELRNTQLSRTQDETYLKNYLIFTFFGLISFFITLFFLQSAGWLAYIISLMTAIITVTLSILSQKRN